MTLSIITLGMTKHNKMMFAKTVQDVPLRVAWHSKGHNVECHYRECHCTECCGASTAAEMSLVVKNK
jgi:hypothetical protein